MRKWIATDEPVAAAGAEVCGLAAIRAAGVDTPEVIGCKHLDGTSLLVLEHVGDDGPPIAPDWTAAGKAVARLHQTTDVTFGFPIPGYLGDFPQTNTRRSDWFDFYERQRIAPLLHVCAEMGRLDEGTAPAIKSLLRRSAETWGHVRFTPSLLHCDLHPKNFVWRAGVPYLIDPSVVYGPAEVDLAFSHIVRIDGGVMSQPFKFDLAFYEAYESFGGAVKLADDHELRRPLWHIFGLLVHVLQDDELQDVWRASLSLALEKLEQNLDEANR